MKTAVIYVRVRADVYNQTAIINKQIDTCMNFAKQKGYMVVNTYIDREVPGVPSERKAQAQLLLDSKSQSWNAVITCALDRISRDYKYIDKYKAILENNGKRLLYIGYDDNAIKVRQMIKEYVNEQKKSKASIYVRVATKKQLNGFMRRNTK